METLTFMPWFNARRRSKPPTRDFSISLEPMGGSSSCIEPWHEGEGFHLYGAPLRQVCSMADRLVGGETGGVLRVVLLGMGIVGR